MENRSYAHSLEDKPKSQWQPLEDHLKGVAQLASGFGDVFGAGQWAFLAGLWHDIGKYSKEFQDYLKRENDIDAHIETTPGRVENSSARLE